MTALAANDRFNELFARSVSAPSGDGLAALEAEVAATLSAWASPAGPGRCRERRGMERLCWTSS